MEQLSALNEVMSVLRMLNFPHIQYLQPINKLNKTLFENINMTTYK